MNVRGMAGFGCRCAECDLQGQVQVPPDLHDDALLTVIAEAPGGHEERLGRPLVGPSGKELDRALAACGHRRDEVSTDNVILCRLPGGGIDAYAKRFRKRQRTREVLGEPPRLHPLIACAGHLERTLADSRALLVLGKTALGALSGARTGEEKLYAQRGFPMTLRGLPAVVTWHPAHVLRNRRWTGVFRSDVAKAFRNATGTLEWTTPRMAWNPTLGQLDAALEGLGKRKLVGCDAETEPGPGREEFDPEHDVLRCIALGTRAFCLSVGFRSVPAQQPPTQWNVPVPIAQERIRNFFARCIGSGHGPVLVMHNGNTYDRPVLRRHGMPLPDYSRVLDTLPLSRNAWSELGHDLDFLASWFTDAPKHKGRAGKKIDHAAWTSDEELHRYCMLDVAVDLAVLDPLLAEVRATEQMQVYRSDVQMQRFAVNAHRAGMRVDEDEVERHAERLEAKMARAEGTAQEAAAESGQWRRPSPINLASVPQVREYLYEGLELPRQVEDEDDEDEDPTTKRDALYELLLTAGLPAHAEQFIQALFDYRSAARSLSKDVRGLRIDTSTGRVHPTWSSLGVTGRPQSQNPNVSNVPDTKRDPDSLRSLYVASEGCVFVACDLEQVELRTVAALSGDEIWLDLFRRADRGETLNGRRIDLHACNASVYFDGKKPWLIEPYERAYAKGLTFMYLYGGGARRAMLNMRQVVNPETGSRPYATMPLKRARDARDKLLKTHHWLPRWWERTVQEWRTDRFLREPVLGRVRKFLDGEGGEHARGEAQRSELINFRAQSAVAGHVSGSGAVGAVMDEIGWPWEGRLRGLGGRGLVHHGYDSLMVEVAERHAETARRILVDAMTTKWTINGNEIAIPAKAKIGRRWSELV